MKSLVSKLILLITAVTLSACSGDPLVSNASTSLDLFVAHVQIVHHPTPNADGSFPDYDAVDGKEFENDLGYTIELHDGALSFHTLTLVSGGDDPDCIEGHDQEVHLNLTESLVGEDLLISSLGTHGIEDRAYCQYELILGAVDHDHPALMQALHDAAEDEHDHDVTASDGADNLTDEHADTAVYLSGHWSKVGSNGEFTIMIADEVTASAAFKAKVDGVSEAHPIHFHEGETELTITFGTKYDKLFEGVDFETDSAAEIKQQVIANIQAGAVHQHLGSSHSS